MSRSQTAEERFDSRYSVAPNGCWIWHGTISAGRRGMGYGELRVHSKITKAHRYSYMRFTGPIPEGRLICHHCDNPLCVNPAHLFVGTQQDNMDDMAAKGRNNQPRGERSGRTYLSNDDVLAIWKSKGRLWPREAARLYRASIATVANIRSGRTWGWLTQEHQLSEGK
jgi:hypothetical protein